MRCITAHALPLAAATLIAAPAGTSAQGALASALHPRARLQVLTAGGERLTGTLLFLSADTLMLTVPAWRPASGAGGPRPAVDLAVPLASVRELYVSRGGRPRGEAAVRGFTVGLAVGALTGLFVAPEHEDVPRGLPAVVFGALGGIAGAFVGATASKGERWERVPVPPTP